MPTLVAYPPTDRFGDALPDEIVRARAKQPRPLRLVFLGNLIPRKGLHTILQAMKVHPLDFLLDVIGSDGADPDYARRMHIMARENGLAKQVRFHGALPDSALIEILKSSQVLVVPSSYEGFGIVYLEGMAFDLPAIGRAVGAAAEIIDDSETGYLVKPDDAPMLAMYLTNLARNRELLARLSVQALARYRCQPAWELSAETIRQFLYDFIRKI